jgi:thiol-disulfide isomerase/thioredoxin
MDDLRGRVVVVDFWTFGCINCLNTLPALRELYERYRETDVALISVHTPEFEREKDVDAVRDAAKRLAIDYPIVIDNDMAIWRSYDNRYWPALYLVDKDGVIRDHHAGELHVGTRAWSRWIARIEALRRPVTPAARSGSPGTRSPDPSAP